MRQKLWLFRWRGGVLLFGGVLLLFVWRSHLYSADDLPTSNLILVGVNAGDPHVHGHGNENSLEHEQGHVQDQGTHGHGHVQQHAQDQNVKFAWDDDAGEKGPAGEAAGVTKELKLWAGTTGQVSGGSDEDLKAAAINSSTGGENTVEGGSNQGSGQGPRVPLVFHQIFRDENLPPFYMMCLSALLRNHRFRDPNKEQIATVNISNNTDYEYDYYLWTDRAVFFNRKSYFKIRALKIFNIFKILKML